MDHERFACQTLPQLALHYRRETLKELEGKSPWLKAFTSAQPDWTEARDHFFKDGSGCINDLEKHIELVRLAISNEELTTTGSRKVLYPIFMAQLHVAVTRTNAKTFVSEIRHRVGR